MVQPPVDQPGSAGADSSQHHRQAPTFPVTVSPLALCCFGLAISLDMVSFRKVMHADAQPLLNGSPRDPYQIVALLLLLACS